MGKRGPRPIPNAIKALRGNPGLRRLNVHPRPEATEMARKIPPPSPPAWLDAGARAKWRELVPLLRQMGVLARIDRGALARYCDTWAWWMRSRKFIEEKGDTYVLRDEEGKPTYIQQYPQVSIAHKLATQLTRLEGEFGLTPAARASIHAGGGAEADRELDPFEQMQRENYSSVVGKIGGA